MSEPASIPHPPPISTETLKLVRDMFQAGRPVAQIAEATGLSEARVERLRPLPPKPKGARR